MKTEKILVNSENTGEFEEARVETEETDIGFLLPACRRTRTLQSHQGSPLHLRASLLPTSPWSAAHLVVIESTPARNTPEADQSSFSVR